MYEPSKDDYLSSLNRILSGDEPVDTDYKFMFNERDAYAAMIKAGVHPGKARFTLRGGAKAIYVGKDDGSRPETHVFLYVRPFKYWLVSKLRKLLPRIFPKCDLDDMLLSHLSYVLEHELIHQVVDEFVGYYPPNDEEESSERVLRNIQNIGNYEGPFSEGVIKSIDEPYVE